MPHCATAALIRKRSVENGSENHTEKTLKIHGKSDENPLRFCIRFGSHFAWILTSFLFPCSVKIGENPLPTGLPKINEFWRPHFPHFWWNSSRFGVPRPPPKITIFQQNDTFYWKMEMSRGIFFVLEGLPWFFIISGWFRMNFYRILHEFLKVSNGFFECFSAISATISACLFVVSCCTSTGFRWCLHALAR